MATWLAARQAIKRVDHNLQLVAKIIGSTIENRVFKKTVKGLYKEREVIFSWTFGDGRGYPMRLRIVHHAAPQKIGPILIDYPRPTEHAWLLGKVIQYRILWGTFSEQEFVAFLDELRKATEIVETGAPFYRN
ncbi:MAG: hypothetical protein Q8N14_06250 [Candidatus Omnitrophota bacterium]|nr:hypothetical protein [Candidatus Omnitrophota bacterium]